VNYPLTLLTCTEIGAFDVLFNPRPSSFPCAFAVSNLIVHLGLVKCIQFIIEPNLLSQIQNNIREVALLINGYKFFKKTVAYFDQGKTIFFDACYAEREDS